MVLATGVAGFVTGGAGFATGAVGFAVCAGFVVAGAAAFGDFGGGVRTITTTATIAATSAIAPRAPAQKRIVSFDSIRCPPVGPAIAARSDALVHRACHARNAANGWNDR